MAHPMVDLPKTHHAMGLIPAMGPTRGPGTERSGPPFAEVERDLAEVQGIKHVFVETGRLCGSGGLTDGGELAHRAGTKLTEQMHHVAKVMTAIRLRRRARVVAS